MTNNKTDKINLLFDGLNHEYNPDYWSDHVRIEIGQLIEELSDVEWKYLEAKWFEQSVDWKARLADASMLSDKPRVIPLLIKMLGDQESKVGASIARVLVEKNYYWEPEVNLVTDLKRHLETATEEEAISLMKLLNRLPT